MDVKLKQRLIGAVVLGALAVIFVPMIVLGPESKGAAEATRVPIEVPPQPQGEFVTREIPLGPAVPVPTPDAQGVSRPAGDDPNALATVDASASVAPRVDALDEAAPVAVDAATGQPVAGPAAPAPAPPSSGSPAARPAEAATPALAGAVPAAPATPPTPVPAPTASPAPVAATARPAPAGSFMVAAGTFASAANAEALVARLVSAGLPATTEPAQINGQPATRVKVGPFADRAAAEAARVRTAAIAGAAASVVSADAPATRTVSTAPRPAGEAPRAAVVDRGFAVQLGAFSSQADAQALVARARGAGFVAFEQRVPTASGPLWRVRLGPVADRPAAERLKGDAQGRLGIAGNVVPHP
ncbi:SPOR domain-containing protein [Silanimonas lenta]|uniref:SPOR domain-containing protein n=1 Tax=Silanimonas lenta TaxID=265429 RepID=UPI000412BB3D|nr:SPOR domain-containing protein [Silanimonas lenta]